jgi:glycosyltransferase involved in cell wall biosynthesis
VRIGVNALLLSDRPDYRRSGIGRYLDRLLSRLPDALGDDELMVYAARDAIPPLPLLADSWRPGRLPIARPAVRVVWEHSVLPILARRDRLDLFHGTVNVLPRFLSCPGVVTIHDLAFLHWPEQVPARRYRYLAREVRSAARRAEQIIAVSESTRQDVIELLDVAPERVTVIHLGVDARFRPPNRDGIDAFRAREGIVRPFVLAVGNLEPRKNLPALLRAFARLAPDVPHDLVLVGAEGWLTDEIHGSIAGLQLDKRVRMTGFVNDDDLPHWYGAADLFVYPSLSEGFGLPLVEAMACGAPVVISNVSSLPEVAGDAAVMVDPHDDESIAEGMRRALTDAALASDLRDRGRRRAAGFTWEETARRTVAVYREVAK